MYLHSLKILESQKVYGPRRANIAHLLQQRDPVHCINITPFYRAGCGHDTPFFLQPLLLAAYYHNRVMQSLKSWFHRYNEQ